MPNVKSAKKRLKTNARDNERNRNARSTLRTALKKANQDVQGGNAETAPDSVQTAICQIGKCASKGIIHKNKAARQTSRLVKKARAAGIKAD